MEGRESANTDSGNVNFRLRAALVNHVHLTNLEIIEKLVRQKVDATMLEA